MLIEINSDSDVWLQVKHALREAGLKTFLQANLFDSARASLFLEPRCEPEGGQLKHGLVVFNGGAIIGSAIQDTYDKETGKQKIMDSR